jgi:endonuclease YncB( thermonuclease family)
MVIILAVWLACAAGAQAEPAGLRAEETVRAARVLDGDTLELADGRLLRLAGIQAPKLPLWRPAEAAWPLAEAAKAALGEFVLGRELRLAYGGARFDRHGRLRAQLFDDAGNWIQAQLLAAGLARVASLADNRQGIAELLRVEALARASRRGLWAESFYRVLKPEEAERRIGSFQLVEGRVLASAVVRGRAYLNFGADWRDDFTVSLAPKVRRLFEREGYEITAYEGLKIRVRGWIVSRNGAMIVVTHPEQIEVLE